MKKEEFSLGKIVGILLPKWPIILIVTIIFGIGAFGISKFFITPTYQTGGTLYVSGDLMATGSNGTQKQQQQEHSTNLSDLMLSQELAKTYGQILSSNTFFKTVAEKSGLGYDFKQIQGMTSITNIEETGILYVTVRNADPAVACLLANKILENANDELARVVVSGSATVIDQAELPTAPASPSIPKNTGIGMIIGFILSVGVIFLMDLLDNTIKTADELEAMFEAPVLGVIPTIFPRNLENEKFAKQLT